MKPRKLRFGKPSYDEDTKQTTVDHKRKLYDLNDKRFVLCHRNIILKCDMDCVAFDVFDVEKDGVNHAYCWSTNGGSIKFGQMAPDEPVPAVAKTLPAITKPHVHGNQIIGVDGQVMTFGGVAIEDPVSMRLENPETFDARINKIFADLKAEGCPHVRVPVALANWRRHGEDIFGAIDICVGLAEVHGMSIVLDYHVIDWMPTSKGEGWNESTIQQWRSFWMAASAKYKNNPAVIAYDIANELKDSKMGNPEQDWMWWSGEVSSLTFDLRRAGDNTLVFIGGLLWSTDLRWFLAHPPDDGNTAVAVHIYPDMVMNDDSKDLVEAMIEVGKQWPVGWFEFAPARKPMMRVDRLLCWLLINVTGLAEAYEEARHGGSIPDLWNIGSDLILADPDAINEVQKYRERYIGILDKLSEMDGYCGFLVWMYYEGEPGTAAMLHLDGSLQWWGKKAFRRMPRKTLNPGGKENA